MLNLNTISLLIPSLSFKEDGNPGKSLPARLGFTFGSFVDQTLSLTRTTLQISGDWGYKNNLYFEILNKKNVSPLIVVLKISIFAAGFFYFPIPTLALTTMALIIKHTFKKTINDAFILNLENSVKGYIKEGKTLNFPDEFGYITSIIKNKHPEWSIVPEVKLSEPYSHGEKKVVSYVYLDKKAFILRTETIEKEFKIISEKLHQFLNKKNTEEEIGIDFKAQLDEIEFSLMNMIESEFPQLKLKKTHYSKNSIRDSHNGI